MIAITAMLVLCSNEITEIVIRAQRHSPSKCVVPGCSWLREQRRRMDRLSFVEEMADRYTNGITEGRN